MDIPNPELQLANDFVRHTSHNIFLTGKAGTGKTTFLHHLKENPPKRMIVTAPTGVAAINAGGVTLHSFFQMPFGPFVPDSEVHRQAEQRRFSKEKRDIIKSLDLLVIDEISMVRSDLLDGIDAVLRRYKYRDQPFGGTQLLMIGDLHQLSPVVKEDERSLLEQYYDSYYFFGSHALRQTGMLSIELKHIYRQSDAEFIRLLNRVRDNRLDGDTLKALNSRHMPAFKPDAGENYITLTTHNRNADNINDTHLAVLNSKPFTFRADIEGTYPEYNYPTAEKLALKKAAQVMFVRNDGSAEKRYFNGKIGKITHIDRESITVKCPDDEDDILIERVTWENIKYSIDPKTKEISEEVIGKFQQYPLRLAWAITIHKSQGLTFERAIIDANAAFSHGQVYVALSRCKTFEGMVLSTPISQSAVRTDSTIAQFVTHASQNQPTQEQLDNAKILYQQKLMLECFDYQYLHMNLTKLIRVLHDNSHLIQFSGMETVENMQRRAFEEIITVGEKFKRQMQSLFNAKMPEDDAHLQERVQKAANYFSGKLKPGLIEWASSFSFDTDNKQAGKQINKALEFLRHTLLIKAAGLESCREGFSNGAYLNALATAEIGFKSKTPAKKPAPGYIDSDIEHPELFNALREWRAEQAAEEEVEHYRVLHQKVLIRIATVLPDTVESLLQIKGIGKRIAEKHGARLTSMVAEYCREHQIKPQPSPTPTPKAVVEKREKPDTKRISYESYTQGKNIKEIAAERGLATNTIEGHLARYVKLGKLDVSDLVTERKINVIKEAFADKGKESLKVVKDHLGDDYSYGEIRLVRESLG